MDDCQAAKKGGSKKLQELARDYTTISPWERSCSEQILTLRNINEQSWEFNQKVFINFVDFKKHLTAFIENQCGK